MTDPIVLRSEILNVLQSGLGVAGTSGSESLASLNSQLISLTARVAKLEGSETYEDENGGTGSSFWYDDDLCICVASGSTVITSTLSAGASVKLLTIDSTDHLPPQGTTFIGAAHAYLSTSSTGGQPVQLALTFNNLDLEAVAESKISATSSNTWYLHYNTMWMTRGVLSNSNITNIGWSSTFLPSPASSDYVYAITKNGVCFVCGFANSIKDGNAYTNSSSTSIGSCAYNPPYYIGTCYGKSGNTITTGYLIKNSGYIHTNIGGSSSNTTQSRYFATIMFDRNNQISLGDFSKNNNINSDAFKTSSDFSYTSAIVFNYKRLHVVQFEVWAKDEFDFTGAWSPTTIFSSSILPTEITTNFATMFQADGVSEYPINVSNGKVIIQLKPELGTGQKRFMACLWLLS